jgi:hypothetical protein
MFNIKRNDRSPAFTATLEDADGYIDLTGCTVKLVMSLAMTGSTPTPKVNAAATVTDTLGGAVSYSWGATDTDTAGLYVAEWEVTFAGGIKRTFPENDYLYVNITPDLA